MKKKYSEIRDELRSGDIIACEKIPLTGIRSLADIGGWLSNRGIRLVQKRGNIDGDGYENLIHTYPIIHDRAHDEVMAFEYTAGMKGLRPFRLSADLAEYRARGGRAHLFRLNAQARHRFDESKVQDFIEKHRNNGYAWEMLAFAQLSFLPIRPFWWRANRKRYYCSAGALAFEIHCNAIASKRKVLRRSGWVTQPESPMEYSVSEFLRRCDLFTRSTQIEVTED